MESLLNPPFDAFVFAQTEYCVLHTLKRPMATNKKEKDQFLHVGTSQQDPKTSEVGLYNQWARKYVKLDDAVLN